MTTRTPRLVELALALGLLLPGSLRAAETTKGLISTNTSMRFTKPAGSVTLTPGARSEPRRIILGDPYVTTGFIRKELPSNATGTPYVSTGALKMENPPKGSTSRATPSAKTTKPQTALVRKIEQACGRTVHDLEVTPESPTELRVRFTARNFSDADKVAKQILRIPEVVSYQVAFEVNVAP